MVDREADGAHLVRERDPRHPLLAGSEAGTEAEPAGQDEAREDALLRVEDDAGADVDDADAGVLGDPRRAFPPLAHRREEVLARRRGLVEHLVAAVAVVPDGRAATNTEGIGSSMAMASASDPGAERPALEDAGACASHSSGAATAIG